MSTGTSQLLESERLTTETKEHYTWKLSEPGRIKNIKILIVEDYVPLRDMLIKALEYDGFSRIITTSDGEDAVNTAKEFKPDVVIMDHSLERMNGLEATKLIKAECPGAVVIALSGLPSPTLILDYLRAGAFSFASKPIRLENLLYQVRRAVDKILPPTSPIA